jgi:hypothetical protein
MVKIVLVRIFNPGLNRGGFVIRLGDLWFLD